MSKGVVPSGFKEAAVTPLINKASLPPDDLKSYWPVSGLRFMSKLVERAVHRQFSEHIHVYNFGQCVPSSFKTGNLTEAALLRPYLFIVV